MSALGDHESRVKGDLMFEWKSQLVGSTEALYAVLDAMPHCVVVLGEGLDVRYLNSAARHEFGKTVDNDHGDTLGEALDCLHLGAASDACGQSEQCEQCVVRQAALDAASGQNAYRRCAVMQLHYGSDIRDVHLQVSASAVEDDAGKMVVISLEDVSENVHLRGLLPVCTSCRTVRDDANYMRQVESYLRDKPVQDFSHGLCPDCQKQLKPSFRSHDCA